MYSFHKTWNDWLNWKQLAMIFSHGVHIFFLSVQCLEWRCSFVLMNILGLCKISIIELVLGRMFPAWPKTKLIFPSHWATLHFPKIWGTNRGLATKKLLSFRNLCSHICFVFLEFPGTNWGLPLSRRSGSIWPKYNSIVQSGQCVWKH